MVAESWLYPGDYYKTNIEGRVFDIDGDFSVNIDFEAKPETVGWIIAFCFFPFGLAVMIFPSKAKGDMQYKADQALAKIKSILDEK